VSQPASQSSSQPSSRRGQVGHGSARSLLLTILGEFVHPQGRPVWTATLIGALGALGVEEKAARQALNRTAAEGFLDSERHGRRVLWTLSEQGSGLLDEGTQRIYSFMRSRRPWDGRWLVLSVPIPESQRQLRHRLRSRLTWLGLGSPTPGLWVSPDAAHSREVLAVIRELGLEEQAFAWAGAATGIGQESKLLADAWDLDVVEDMYLAFLEEFEDRDVEGARAAFVAQVEMVQAWRRFPSVDPDLPAELLDHDWPGPRAANVFHQRHARWQMSAWATWETLVSEAGPLPTA
jgi:phenylacetic acid degradation operon negative regulatory protein